MVRRHAIGTLECRDIAVLVVLTLLARLAGAAEAPLTVGVVDESLLIPYEWAKADAGVWNASACMAAYEQEGFRTKRLGAGDLTPEGLRGLDVVVIVGDHVYPEKGPWGGPVLKALAEFVRGGGVYVMPIGVSHYVARDIDTGRRDTGHFGPDPLGLTFEVVAGVPPLALTRQGKAVGLPEPGRIGIAPIRGISNPGKCAILAWDAQYVPAMVVLPVDKGHIIHTGCGEKPDPSFPGWWYMVSARAARAARDGKLTFQSISETMKDEGLEGMSLDDMDRRAFKPASSPLDSEATPVDLKSSPRLIPPPCFRLSLDGEWRMVGCEVGKGSEKEMLDGHGWEDAIPAVIPGSVHTALLAAGKIPDPTVGLNADVAREASYREWWFRREFDVPQDVPRARLVFDGVDYSCTVWLNGVRLGRHEGAFGGPDYNVTGLLRPRNVLVVRLDPAPAEWPLVLKTNVVYGWHYVNLPSLGIWRSVRLDPAPSVEICNPFVAARDAQAGVVDLCLSLRSRSAGFSGVLRGVAAPEDSGGEPLGFEVPVSASTGECPLHLRMTIPSPKLWWPNGLGGQNLYRLTLAFEPDKGGDAAVAATTFGIRTVETRPLPDGPSPARYNWTFVINGRPVFMKGANWCIQDALLRLDAARYARFLGLAKAQHLQLLRAWGGGLLETDEFYDQCDRLGIMVYQEFPLTWQRFEVLSPSVVDETATRNVLRLRNHPSLLMWGGGNEHSGRGNVIEQIGRICLELDGSRPFHRTDPYGGSLHNYDVYWGGKPLERNLTLTAPFLGEFGLSSPPCLESVLRYLPPEERDVWPPKDNGSFIRHTPTYAVQHLEIMNRYASDFADTGTMAGLITGMQLAQATGIRHTLERARTRWPEATGVCYYKLTDVYPACAWAAIDWYGVPKIAYYVIQDAYAPVLACARFDQLSAPPGEPLRVPVFLLDDAGDLTGPWQVIARAYDPSLTEIVRAEFPGHGAVDRVKRLGDLTLTAEQAQSAPLLVVTEVSHQGKTVHRTFYWLNYAGQPGCLFKLPAARLEVKAEPNALIVKNTGEVPAVGVHFDCPAISDHFTVEDAYFWLDPGEERRLEAGETQGVKVMAWNAANL
jgi:beta-mannosidase